ncbi:MAG: hypothetical protein HQK86_12100 [Nitrospinae bacterium]|nr:hypothetical protein [Nitrospinota bacterium]MBF0635041.1 hypothetical protein [Nitrospinota bacterium]
MGNKNPRGPAIKSPTDEQLKNLIARPVLAYIETVGISNPDDVVVDLGILAECCIRIEKTLDGGFDPNEECNNYKHAAVICFWLRKLKPFTIGNASTSHFLRAYVNETIAFFAAYMYLYDGKDNSERPRITPQFLKDFMVALRYHSYSPHALVQVFEALSIKTGIPEEN